LGRNQSTPSSLSNIQQPIDQQFDFDQENMQPEEGSFMVLEPFSVVTLLLIVGILKLMFN